MAEQWRLNPKISLFPSKVVQVFQPQDHSIVILGLKQLKHFTASIGLDVTTVKLTKAVTLMDLFTATVHRA